ncbi:MAG: hypothetical protein Unbinned3338contig1000_60 [Prokaryotic dsDNA virus sp.]|nr:MAG: hypothetical protein Unbinned3338contig1000_60 [Prokaryotic dsDNA virus sp.]|tara:strand:+ start:45 stop:170 length:126 start_codon:yes stop_codon:yes gene_type:complete
MDNIEITEDTNKDLESTVNGVVIKDLITKINEIIDWINNQS